MHFCRDDRRNRTFPSRRHARSDRGCLRSYVPGIWRANAIDQSKIRSNCDSFETNGRKSWQSVDSELAWTTESDPRNIGRDFQSGSILYRLTGRTLYRNKCLRRRSLSTTERQTTSKSFIKRIIQSNSKTNTKTFRFDLV